MLIVSFLPLKAETNITPQMYKVFFKESSFLLTDNKSRLKNVPDVFVHTDTAITCNHIYALLQQDDIFHITIYHPDISRLFEDFKACFKVVGAAGGVVRQNDTILMIKRLGMYDLPKGHIEPGENTEACAVREVTEECGVQGLEIDIPLNDTWHIYYRDGQWHLKYTRWFVMHCPPTQHLTPQTEEDIEEVFWLKTVDISRILPETYASLRPVLEQIQKQDF